MLELCLLALWLFAAFEVFCSYSLLVTVLFLILSYLAANYGPLLVGYESARANDAVWMIEAPTNLMNITSCGIYEKATAEDMREVLDGRIFYGQKRARQYFTHVLGRPFWVEDKNYSFDAHLHVIHEPIKTEKELCRITSEVAATPFPAKYPPWAFYLVENYLDNKSAIINKFHHALLDGISAISSTVHCSDEDCGRDFFKMPKMTMTQQTIYTLLAAAVLPYFTVTRLLYREDSNPLCSGSLTGVKSMHWTKPYLLSEYKAHCKSKGITLNDFLAAACLRTVRRYVAREHGKDCNNFTIFMPFSLRGQPEDGSPLPVNNDFSAILIKMPPANSPTLETDCARIFHRMKTSIEPYTCHLAVNLLGSLPRTIGKYLLFKLANKATFLFSNVPGPRSTLKFKGVKMLHLMSMSPMEAQCGVAMTILSYAEEFTISCYGDVTVVKDAEVLARMLEEEIESLGHT